MSVVDLRLLALAVSEEVSTHGRTHLREAPTRVQAVKGGGREEVRVNRRAGERAGQRRGIRKTVLTDSWRSRTLLAGKRACHRQKGGRAMGGVMERGEWRWKAKRWKVYVRVRRLLPAS